MVQKKTFYCIIVLQCYGFCRGNQKEMSLMVQTVTEGGGLPEPNAQER